MSARLTGFGAAAIILAAGIFGAPALSAPSGGSGSCDELLTLVRKQTALFKDLRLEVEITQQNQKELATISDDFGKAYEFKRSKLVFSSPDSFKISAKAGIVTWTANLGRRWASRKVRVNAIAPGEIETSILSPGTEKIVETLPLRRLGQPREVADVIWFLCSDASSYVTGTEIEVNAGQHV